MEIKLYTLVDITQSGTRKGTDRVAVAQQANWDTVVQVIGLRANPVPIKLEEHNAVNKSFGTSFKGKQKYWVLTFEMPEGSTNIDALVDDFHLVPVLVELTETAQFELNIFNTKDPKHINTFFELD
jgi:hypothetical protein